MKKIKKVFLLLILTLLFIPCVNAEQLNDTLLTNKEDVMYRTDNMKAEDDLHTIGNYDSSTFFAGNSVYDSTNVDGISFIAGNNVNINGNYEYGMILGNVATLSGIYEKDFFMIGNMVTTTSEFNVKKDVYMFSTMLNLSGNIGRNMFVAGESITLEDVTVNGSLNLYATDIIIGDNVKINGTLKYNEDATINGLETANIGTTLTYEATSNIEVDNTMFLVQEFFISLVSLILLGILIYVLCPKVFNNLTDKTKNYNFVEGLKDTSFGFLTLIGFPIFMLMLFFSIFFIPISIIGLLLYGIAIYLTILVVGYPLGNIILKKLFKKEGNPYLSIIIGVLVIKLLKIIPVVGWLISFIVLCLGLGLIVKLIFHKGNEKELINETIVEPKKTTRKTKKEN